MFSCEKAGEKNPRRPVIVLSNAQRDRERVARQRGEHIRRSRLAVDIGVGLVRGGEGLDAGLAELAGVLAVLGLEVTRTLADDIEVEFGEEVCDPLSFVVVWHGSSFPRLL